MQNDYAFIMLALLGFVLLIIVMGLFLKKIRVAKADKNKQMKIMNVVSMGSKEKLVLVEVRDKILLLGATPHSINTLHVFPNEFSINLDDEKFSFSSKLHEVGDFTG